MLKIGVTGGIGSGKSTVCKVFSLLGISVYHADEKARDIIQQVPEIKESIIKEFGAESFLNDSYNSTYIGNIVFGNKKKLHLLNSIIHPHVANDFLHWTSDKANEKYVIEEAAILFESGANRNMDYVIVVNAPPEIRIQRITNRDGHSEDKILRRMKNQWPTEKIRALADWIIENDEKHLLLPQVLSIHNQLIS